MILTKELVIATDQCTEYQFKAPFFPGVSCEDIYNKNPESHDWPGYYWILELHGPSNVYCGMNYTGSSCEDIYNNNPEIGDNLGYFCINGSQWTYCNMTAIVANGDLITTYAGVGGGWRRIANINISAGDDCPGDWRKATQSNVTFCRVASDDQFTCSSANFSTNGISYERVCGRARGYQKGATLGLYLAYIGPNAPNVTIDDSYVGGLSITYGSNPRKHIWMYAAGNSETASNFGNCPCATSPGRDPPSYVGNNYYCETASVGSPNIFTYYFDDVLWDGEGCSGGTCCDNTKQPWFYRQLNQTTQDDIEGRICTRGDFIGRSTLIDQLELYIQ